ncbi:acyltransferase domain-containing protein [Ditylenchus destructor]|nr:acyltransferase domain-containing protein [Ditylenchus destructor]
MIVINILRRLFGPLIGISFAIIVLGTSVFGNYIVTLFLPMISILNRHRQWRELMDRAITFWMVIPLFFLHFIFGVRVRVSGDTIDASAPAIIIMNHRTRLDWFYFWLALWRINPWLMTTNKIALKELLRHTPGAGFGMQASQYVFLKRDLDIDTKRLSRAVDYYADMQRPYQILMFPEGTDKTEYTTRRSREYATKYGLQDFKNVLHPRTAGFIHLVKKMIANNYLTYIYDVTVAYPRDPVQNETDMILKGRVSTNVHYDIRKWSIDKIPTQSDAVLNKWLLDVWTEKDEKLERFYSQKIKGRRKLETGGARNLWVKDDFRQILVKVVGFFFWVTVVSVWLYHMQFLRFVQVGLVWLILNYLYIYIIYGGIDNLIYCRWERWRAKQPNFLVNSTSIV